MQCNLEHSYRKSNPAYYNKTFMIAKIEVDSNTNKFMIAKIEVNSNTGKFMSILTSNAMMVFTDARGTTFVPYTVGITKLYIFCLLTLLSL